MRLSSCLLLMSAMMSLPLSAQNLVVNGTFDEDLDSWFASSGENISYEWAALDAGDEPDSGSILVGNLHPAANNGVVVEQCLPAIAGHQYRLGGKVRVPSGAGQSLADRAVLSLRWKSDRECNINNGGSVTFGQSPSAFDTWFTVGPSTVTAREGAQGVVVRLLLSKMEDGTTFFALFDDVYLIPQDEIFAGGFDQ